MRIARQGTRILTYLRVIYSMCSNCSPKSRACPAAAAAAALCILQVRSELASVPASKPYRDFSFFCVVGYICNANFVKFANITRNRRVVPTTSTAADVDNAKIFATACSPAMTMYAEGFVETWPGKIDASTTKRLSVP